MKPDDVIVLPWNLADEIVHATPEVRAWGGRLSRGAAPANVVTADRIGIPMRFVPTTRPGVTLIDPEPIADDSGHFARLYCPDEFARAGIEFIPTQTSLSFNHALHTLRGMHYCLEPEAKLVRCTRGRIFDVAVDIRRDSPTFRRWFGVELDPTHARTVHSGRRRSRLSDTRAGQ